MLAYKSPCTEFFYSLSVVRTLHPSQMHLHGWSVDSVYSVCFEGDLGVVNVGDLPPALEAVAIRLRENQASEETGSETA